jgi:hypothetical protein
MTRRQYKNTRCNILQKEFTAWSAINVTPSPSTHNSIKYPFPTRSIVNVNMYTCLKYVIHIGHNVTKLGMDTVWWCLTPLSTIFQLYPGGQKTPDVTYYKKNSPLDLQSTWHPLPPHTTRSRWLQHKNNHIKMFIWIQGIVSFPDDSFVPLHQSHGISEREFFL